MEEKLLKIIDAIEEKKGKDILVLDFEGKNSLCDKVVIATPNSERNTQAIADEINKKMNESGEKRLGIEGYKEANWILIDYDDIVVHLLNKENREYYALEQLWNEAKEVIRK
ncbi:MAG: iojap-like protein [Fusobacteriales bacterium]|jgi:ribosome-associated protein|nr:iojap-like protein [Fusobacteriales bacterium]